ncbi:MAG: hypothetical protein PW845_03925 [Pseudomonas sp.]|nr:hypothetical protein [Pseudomonas sp.]
MSENSTSAEAFERLPILSFKPLEMQAVGRAVLEQPRHQEAAEAVAGLGEHDEGIAHRRRQEPFVAGEAVDALADALGGGRVGAHIGAALFFGHAHADGDGGFLHGRLVGRIIFARQDFWRPVLLDGRRGHHRGNGGAGHRQRAEMAAFELRRQIEAGGPHLVRLVLGFGVGLRIPDRRMQADRHRAAHQRMPGRMEFDDILALAARPVGLQLRHALVGHARQFLRLVRGDETAHLLEIVANAARQSGSQIDDQRIGTIGIDAGPKARLVQIGQRVFIPGRLGHEPLLAEVTFSGNVRGKDSWRCAQRGEVSCVEQRNRTHS